MKSMVLVEISGGIKEMTMMQEICPRLIDGGQEREAYQKEARKTKGQENRDECRKEISNIISHRNTICPNLVGFHSFSLIQNYISQMLNPKESTSLTPVSQITVNILEFSHPSSHFLMPLPPRSM
jgi:hypothetical protein